ncbi:hypothetical protein HUG15_19080 [Salicibibacter cibarius]|uniref:Uncharacterized protein n=1 Tax=Salicibibacter cibarius TaxID=2743000 RepID=A0A7T6Z5V0_9BACI|nr:hypothetical protein [Salicibibacter cibarius]QQK77476.1 hypothetical protein HUG15_19080 [Salicibibacter cibarius]
MVPISIEKFVKMHCETNPDEEPKQLRENLKEAVADKKAGATCFNCEQEIWAIGSAIVYNGCFTCLTGDADSSEDYEIDDVCWS